MPEITAPPKWILFLLWPFKGEPCYPQIEGDLSEEFQQRELEHGLPAARRWYFREVCRNLLSLTWRWETILVIAIPLLCISLSNTIWYRLIGLGYTLITHDLLRVNSWNISSLTFYILLNWSLVGLSLGIVCGRIFSGHEQMVRLVFGAYYLGLTVFSYRAIGIAIAGMQTQSLLATAYRLMYFKPIGTLVCIWIGSMWIERRHRRHSAA